MMNKRKNEKYQDDVIHRPIRSANSRSTQQYGMDKKSSKTVTKKAATIFKFLGLCVAALTLFFNMSTRTLEKKVSEAVKISPFKMPIQGDKFSIFQPLYDMDDAEKDAQIFGNTKDILSTFKKRIEWASTLIHDKNNVKPASVEEHAQSMYFEMIKNHVSALVFNNAELSVVAILGRKPGVGPLKPHRRKNGIDWTFVGDTMTGEMRLDNVKDLILDVVKENVKGDYIETGVWRGGSSVFARAVLTALGEEKNRVSYVCDSFAGLPPGEKKLDKEDAGWDSTPYLEVPSSIVANNFIKYGLLDSNVIFAKGFFNETMPPLSEKIQSLSIMRLDGDMYESTVDVLYNLYDKLSIGGYVIMDDWSKFPSKTACEDFFKVHGISPKIVNIDPLSVYWKKTEHVDIQHWRYKQSKFKIDQTSD